MFAEAVRQWQYARRFLPPRLIEELNACVVVSDGAKKLTCFYFVEEPGRRSAAKLLTRGGRHGQRPQFLEARA
jgi:hypothetical protein